MSYYLKFLLFLRLLWYNPVPCSGYIPELRKLDLISRKPKTSYLWSENDPVFKSNFTPLIWRGTNFSFIVALYCSCLGLNAFICLPTRREAISALNSRREHEIAAMKQKSISQYTSVEYSIIFWYDVYSYFMSNLVKLI